MDVIAVRQDHFVIAEDFPEAAGLANCLPTCLFTI